MMNNATIEICLSEDEDNISIDVANICSLKTSDKRTSSAKDIFDHNERLKSLVNEQIDKVTASDSSSDDGSQDSSNFSQSFNPVLNSKEKSLERLKTEILTSNKYSLSSTETNQQDKVQQAPDDESLDTSPGKDGDETSRKSYLNFVFNPVASQKRQQHSTQDLSMERMHKLPKQLPKNDDDNQSSDDEQSSESFPEFYVNNQQADSSDDGSRGSVFGLAFLPNHENQFDDDDYHERSVRWSTSKPDKLVGFDPVDNDESSGGTSRESIFAIVFDPEEQNDFSDVDDALRWSTGKSDKLDIKSTINDNSTENNVDEVRDGICRESVFNLVFDPQMHNYIDDDDGAGSFDQSQHNSDDDYLQESHALKHDAFEEEAFFDEIKSVENKPSKNSDKEDLFEYSSSRESVFDLAFMPTGFEDFSENESFVKSHSGKWSTEQKESDRKSDHSVAVKSSTLNHTKSAEHPKAKARRHHHHHHHHKCKHPVNISDNKTSQLARTSASAPSSPATTAASSDDDDSIFDDFLPHQMKTPDISSSKESVFDFAFNPLNQEGGEYMQEHSDRWTTTDSKSSSQNPSNISFSSAQQSTKMSKQNNHSNVDNVDEVYSNHLSKCLNPRSSVFTSTSIGNLFQNSVSNSGNKLIEPSMTSSAEEQSRIIVVQDEDDAISFDSPLYLTDPSQLSAATIQCNSNETGDDATDNDLFDLLFHPVTWSETFKSFSELKLGHCYGMMTGLCQYSNNNNNNNRHFKLMSNKNNKRKIKNDNRRGSEELSFEKAERINGKARTSDQTLDVDSDSDKDDLDDDVIAAEKKRKKKIERTKKAKKTKKGAIDQNSNTDTELSNELTHNCSGSVDVLCSSMGHLSSVIDSVEEASQESVVDGESASLKHLIVNNDGTKQRKTFLEEFSNDYSIEPTPADKNIEIKDWFRKSIFAGDPSDFDNTIIEYGIQLVGDSTSDGNIQSMNNFRTELSINNCNTFDDHNSICYTNGISLLLSDDSSEGGCNLNLTNLSGNINKERYLNPTLSPKMKDICAIGDETSCGRLSKQTKSPLEILHRVEHEKEIVFQEVVYHLNSLTDHSPAETLATCFESDDQLFSQNNNNNKYKNETSKKMNFPNSYKILSASKIPNYVKANLSTVSNNKSKHIYKAVFSNDLDIQSSLNISCPISSANCPSTTSDCNGDALPDNCEGSKPFDEQDILYQKTTQLCINQSDCNCCSHPTVTTKSGKCSATTTEGQLRKSMDACSFSHRTSEEFFKKLEKYVQLDSSAVLGQSFQSLENSSTTQSKLCQVVVQPDVFVSSDATPLLSHKQNSLFDAANQTVNIVVSKPQNKIKVIQTLQENISTIADIVADGKDSNFNLMAFISEKLKEKEYIVDKELTEEIASLEAEMFDFSSRDVFVTKQNSELFSLAKQCGNYLCVLGNTSNVENVDDDDNIENTDDVAATGVELSSSENEKISESTQDNNQKENSDNIADNSSSGEIFEVLIHSGTEQPEGSHKNESLDDVNDIIDASEGPKTAVVAEKQIEDVSEQETMKLQSEMLNNAKLSSEKIELQPKVSQKIVGTESVLMSNKTENILMQELNSEKAAKTGTSVELEASENVATVDDATRQESNTGVEYVVEDLDNVEMTVVDSEVVAKTETSIELKEIATSSDNKSGTVSNVITDAPGIVHQLEDDEIIQVEIAELTVSNDIEVGKSKEQTMSTSDETAVGISLDIDDDEAENKRFSNTTAGIDILNETDKVDTSNVQNIQQTKDIESTTAGVQVLNENSERNSDKHSKGINSIVEVKSASIEYKNKDSKKTNSFVKEQDEESEKTNSVVNEQNAEYKKTNSVVKEQDEDSKKTNSVVKEQDEESKKTNSVVKEQDEESKKTNSVINEQDEKSKKTNSVVKEQDEDSKKTNSVVNEQIEESKKTNSFVKEQDEESKKTNSVVKEQDEESKKTNSVVKEQNEDSKKTNSVVKEQNEESKKTNSVVNEQDEESKKTNSVVKEQDEESKKTNFVVKEQNEESKKTISVVKVQDEKSEKTNSVVKEQDEDSKMANSVVKEQDEETKKNNSIVNEQDNETKDEESQKRSSVVEKSVDADEKNENEESRNKSSVTNVQNEENRDDGSNEKREKDYESNKNEESKKNRFVGQDQDAENKDKESNNELSIAQDHNNNDNNFQEHFPNLFLGKTLNVTDNNCSNNVCKNEHLSRNQQCVGTKPEFNFHSLNYETDCEDVDIDTAC